MFSLKVVDTDEFLDMGQGSQLLYFHLAMRADDDGFVNSPKKIQKIIGASDDEVKVLITKQFILPFQSGVIVIRHWKENNYIQADRYKETIYKEEKAMLSEDSNNVYKMDTKSVQNVSSGKVRLELGKVRLGKVMNTSEPKDSRVNEIMEVFIKENPSIKWGNKTQRKACEEMLAKWPQPDAVKNMALQVLAVQKEKYAPRATTPLKMWEKITEFKNYFESRNVENKVTKVGL